MNSEEFNDFEPKFRSDVFITAADGEVSDVNSWDCATNRCAYYLATVLSDLQPQFKLDHPHGSNQSGGGFSANDAVPWLGFPNDLTGNPPVVWGNAGRLASYWEHGLTPDNAERDCRKDIENMKLGK